MAFISHTKYITTSKQVPEYYLLVAVMCDEKEKLVNVKQCAEEQNVIEQQPHNWQQRWYLH